MDEEEEWLLMVELDFTPPSLSKLLPIERDGLLILDDTSSPSISSSRSVLNLEARLRAESRTAADFERRESISDDALTEVDEDTLEDVDEEDETFLEDDSFTLIDEENSDMMLLWVCPTGC